ncbi:YehS family protein [Niallia sp. 03190]|uniref:YehS family protein n=1 Tax=Niallia sp. 03190 TaxID=3458061 RepID=UPI004044C405
MNMNNNDILIRLRYALDIKNADMVEIFKLGGIEVTKEEVLKMLIKSKDSYHNEVDSDGDINEDNIECNNFTLESFLNGLIIFKRGKQDSKPGQPERPAISIKNNGSVNNVLLKKLKIALALTSEDMLDILGKAGVVITKGELSALFRKEGHKNYVECGDRYARNFLKGLALKYRE